MIALAEHTDTFFGDTIRAVDTLVLEGLLYNDADTFVSPTDTNRHVVVPSKAIDWLDIYADDVHSLYMMLDTSVFETDEIAVA